VVGGPDEGAGTLFSLDGLGVPDRCSSRVSTELRDPSEGAGDAAEGEKAARGGDHPVAERLEQRLELGAEISVLEQRRCLAQLFHGREPVGVAWP
jgi:hypothetical protein